MKLHRIGPGWYVTDDKMFYVERDMDNPRFWVISVSYDGTDPNWEQRVDKAQSWLDDWLDSKGHPSKKKAVESLQSLYDYAKEYDANP